uniref:Putative r-kappa-b n=1 Tax=Anopheles darlingi TaxID=43151 RepID=A0A2M4CIX1_ANODA
MADIFVRKEQTSVARPASDGYAETENSFATSSGSDSEESNTSLLETNSILSEKLILPKDLCHNEAIFNEFFIPSIWDTLPPSAKQYLRTFLPETDHRSTSSKVVNDLLSRRLDRFGLDQIKSLQVNLAKGNFRADIAKLRQTLSKSVIKEQRMLDLQRYLRLARNVLLSREVKLMTEVHNQSHQKIAFCPRNRPNAQFPQSSKRDKFRTIAKKRYLSEIVGISETIGVPLSLSDEEECYEICAAGPVRKNRKIYSASSATNESNMGSLGTSNLNKRCSTYGSSTGVYFNSMDGSSFTTSKLCITDTHYHRLLTQHQKRKITESDNPEMDLEGLKLKDVVTRTQIAAGYRRILPFPKHNGLTEIKGEFDDIETRETLWVKSTSMGEKQIRIGHADNKSTKQESKARDGEQQIKAANLKSLSYSLETSKHNEENEPLPPKSEVLKAQIDSYFNDPDLEETIKGVCETPKPSPTMYTNSHSCFFSLVRDLFCSSHAHRLTIDELLQKISDWYNSLIVPRQGWYTMCATITEWQAMLQSAVQFLAGDFHTQLKDFVPYIERKKSLNVLQWIGASRDGDARLEPLCEFWHSLKQHENEKLTDTECTSPISTMVVMAPGTRQSNVGNGQYNEAISLKDNEKWTIDCVQNSLSNSFGEPALSNVEPDGMLQEDDDGSTSERCETPPPPRYPTDWTVRKATDEEIRSFRLQERQRYENPHMAYTYREHSYNSVVGPVKGIYTQVPGMSKARGHSMLVADRPNFVTILTLVRDATARLPNGEGTRADICELLKSSQYISSSATEQILQTIVSGALDRMHTEHDPCVKYDTKRKMWIYLHRNRTEEEFEKLHHQYQGITKHKKTSAKRLLKNDKEVVSPRPKTSNGSLGDPTSNMLSSELSSTNFVITQNIPQSDVLGKSSGILPSVATQITAPSLVYSVMDKIDATDISALPGGASSYLVNHPTSLLKKQHTNVSSTSSLSICDQPSILPMDKAYSSIIDLKLHQTEQNIMSSSVTASCSKDHVPITTASTENITNPTPTIGIMKPNSVNSQNYVPVSTYLPTGELSSTMTPASRTPNSSIAQSSLISYALHTKPFTYSMASTKSIDQGNSSPIVSVRQAHSGSICTGSQRQPIFSLVTNGQSAPTIVSQSFATQSKPLQIKLSMTGSATSSSTSGVVTLNDNSNVGKQNTSAVQPSMIISRKFIMNPAPLGTTLSSDSINQNNVALDQSEAIMLDKDTSTIPISKPTPHVIKTSASPVSTITLASGQQSILSPAQQKQILQNLLTQQQKQSIVNWNSCKKTEMSHTISMTNASDATKAFSDGTKNDDEKNNVGGASQLVSQLNTSGKNTSSFMHQQMQKLPRTNSQILKFVSPQILKITPRNLVAFNQIRTSSCPTPTPKNSGGSNSHTVEKSSFESSNCLNTSTVKVTKLNSSNLLATPNTQIITKQAEQANSNANVSTALDVIVSVSSIMPTATMRVLKTGTGTTNLTKSNSTAAASINQSKNCTEARHIMNTYLKKSLTQIPKASVTSGGSSDPFTNVVRKQCILTPLNVESCRVTQPKPSSSNMGHSAHLKMTNNQPKSPVRIDAVYASETPSPGAVTSGVQQYTILPQPNVRGVIPAKPKATSSTLRESSGTIIEHKLNQSMTFASEAECVVEPNKTVANTDGISSSVSTTIGNFNTTGPTKLSQATKIKVISTNPLCSNVTIAHQQQQSHFGRTIKGPKQTISGLTNGVINAKIVGIRNVASSQPNVGSSLSIVNSPGTNFTPIGGTPVNNSKGASDCNYNKSIQGSSLLTTNVNCKIKTEHEVKEHTSLPTGKFDSAVAINSTAGTCQMFHQSHQSNLVKPNDTVEHVCPDTAEVPASISLPTVANNITVTSGSDATTLGKSIVKIRHPTLRDSGSTAKVVDVSSRLAVVLSPWVILATSSGYLFPPSLLLGPFFSAVGLISMAGLKVVPGTNQNKNSTT